MNQTNIQAALQTLLQALSTFDDEDVTLGNYLVLDRGSAPYAIITPGPFELVEIRGDGMETVIAWTNYIDVAANFRDDSYADIIAAEDAVLEQLLKYPTLDGTGGVLAATVMGGGPARYLYMPGGDHPQFVIKRITHRTHALAERFGGGEL